MRVHPKWLLAGYCTGVPVFKNSGQRRSCNLPTRDVEEIFKKCDVTIRVKPQSTESVNPPKRTPLGQKKVGKFAFLLAQEKCRICEQPDHVQTDVTNRRKAAETTRFPPQKELEAVKALTLMLLSHFRL